MAGSGTTRVGTALTGIAVGVGITLLATAAGSVRAMAVSAIAGLLLGTLVVLRARGTALGTGIASLLLPVVAVLAVGGLGLSIADAVLTSGSPGGHAMIRRLIEYVGVSLAAGTAAAGTVGTLGDGIGDGGVTALWGTTVGTLAPIFLWIVFAFSLREVAIAAALAGFDAEPIVRPIFRPRDPILGLATLWLLILVLVAAFRGALRASPVIELSPRSRRPAIAETLERVDSAVRILIGTLLTLPIVVGGIVAVAVGTELFTLPAGVVGLADAARGPGLRTVIVTGIVAFGSVTLAVGVLRRVTGNVAERVGQVGPSIAGGVVAVLAVTVVSPLVWEGLAVVPAAQRPAARAILTRYSPSIVALAVVAIALLMLASLLSAVAIAGGLRLVPARASASAIASGGLAIGALAVGITVGSPVTVFGIVALSIVAWDAGERGVVTRTELGTTSPARLEVVQTLGTTVVTGGAIALAWVIYTVVLPGITAQRVTVVGVLSAVVAVLLLVFALRG